MVFINVRRITKTASSQTRREKEAKKRSRVPNRRNSQISQPSSASKSKLAFKQIQRKPFKTKKTIPTIPIS